MAGIISNAMAPAQAAPQVSTNITNPILKNAKEGIEQKVKPAIKDQMLRIENAGLALLSSGKMPQLVLQKLKSSNDTAGVVSDGVANMIAVIYNQVSPKIPQDQLPKFNTTFVASAPAASVALMCQVLDMAEKALSLQITPQLVAQCTQKTGKKALAKLHIGDQQIQQAVSAGKQATGAQ